MAAHLGEGLRFPTSATLQTYPPMRKASGVNSEEKSGVRVPKAICLQLLRHRWCQTVLVLAVPLDSPAVWKEETCCMGNSVLGIVFRPGFSSQLCHEASHNPRKDTPASSHGTDTTKRAKVSNYKLLYTAQVV